MGANALRTGVCALVILSFLLATGCKRRGGADYGRPLADGQLALAELPPSAWPRFTLAGQQRTELTTAIDRSLNYLKKPSAKARYPRGGISHAQAVSGLERFRALIAEVSSDDVLNSRLRAEFRVFRSIGWDGRGTVLFTGYYTPIFDASPVRTERFRYPLHGRPADLISPADPKQVSQQRLPDGSTRPYPTRAELEASGALNGLEIAWLAEPYDPLIIEVQGSARLRLPDGSIREIGYAGTTGHNYVAIAHELIKDGKLRREQLGLPAIRAYFRKNPHEMPVYAARNPRKVFFTDAPGGPFGSLNERVTADVSVATDKDIFPPGALCFVTTRDHRLQPYAAFRLDQDTGGAIRAPGKCDLFMGIGAEAEQRAGRQYQEGALYYLVGR